MNDRSLSAGRLFQELRRRRVFRTAALYIVGSWLVLQVSDVVFPALGLNDLAVRYVLFALVLGFPAALIFGWFYDIGAHGIRRTAPADPEETAEAQPLRRVDYLILTALVAVLGAAIYSTVGNVVEPPRAELPAERSGPPMVAVLPFTTTTREGDSEFFAAGVHDDLLTQLSKLQSLRVISRTSVMEYRDVARNLREIAAELGADVIMEGGVQVAGEQIRINAQLIDARTDAHLWAQTYDRELAPTNIFEVQSEIARAISTAMRTTLTPQDVDQLAIIPTDNMAAYRAYRRAMDMAEQGNVYRNPDYRAALEEAVALDPNFTRAWAELAGYLSYRNFWGERDLEEIARAEEILDMLRDTAPNSVEYLMALAYYTLYTLKDYDQAFAVILQAEERAPSDLKILEMKTWILRRQGRHAERNAVFRKILELNPKDQGIAVALVGNLVNVHRYDEAEEKLSRLTFDGYHVSTLRASLDLREHGDFERYIRESIEIEKEFADESRPVRLWEAYLSARDFERAAAMLDELKNPRFDPLPGLGAWLAGRLITYWFMQDDELFQQALVDALQHLEQTNTQAIAADTGSLYLDLSLIPALQGDIPEVVRLLRLWRRNVNDATAELVTSAMVCQTLAMAGAAREAVECIRDGLVEPSYIRAWIEPHLPFYDPIRTTPEFQALLAEVQQTGQ